MMFNRVIEFIRHTVVMTACCLFMASAQAQVDERYDWDKWEAMGIQISYYSVVKEKDGVSFWFDAQINREGLNAVIGLFGTNLSMLKQGKTYFDGTLFKKYKKHKPERKTPIISRTCVTKMKDGSYVTLTQIGPEYRGGASELYPVLLTSKTGNYGDWKNLGAPKGEPLTWLNEMRKKNKRIRCEGGRVFQLEDGSFKMYIQGFGVKLALAHAKTLDGEWTFLRDEEGKIVDLLKGVGQGWLFPYVMRIGGHGYVVTGADQWPPTRVDVAYSIDGVSFEQAKDKTGKPLALITPDQILKGATSMKVLRGAYDEASGKWIVAANVWDKKKRNYELYSSTVDFPIFVFDQLKSLKNNK